MEERKEKVRKIAQQLNIIDDTMFQKMAEDAGFCEEMISTILQQAVTVKKVTPQNSIRNLQGRSVTLDALCVLENQKQCMVEVQKANDDDHQRRMRYNTSCITANITDPGLKFRQVPDVIGIYISKFDLFQAGKTVYHVERVIRETGEVLDNGLYEIYVNAKVDDGSDIAQLMRIFIEDTAYDFEKFPRVSQRKRQFKEEDGGTNNMCDLVEQYAKEYAKEYAEEVAEERVKENARGNALRFFQNGGSYELVRASIPSLSGEDLQEIYREAGREIPEK